MADEGSSSPHPPASNDEGPAATPAVSSNSFVGLLGAARDAAGLTAILSFLEAEEPAFSARKEELLAAARLQRESAGTDVWDSTVARAFGATLRAWGHNDGDGDDGEKKEDGPAYLYAFGKPGKNVIKIFTDRFDELVELEGPGTFGDTGGFCHVGGGDVYTFHSDGVWRISLETRSNKKVSSSNFKGYHKIVHWDGSLWVFGVGGKPVCRYNADTFEYLESIPNLTFGSTGGFCHVGGGVVYTFHSDGVWRITLGTRESEKVSSHNFKGYHKIVHWDGGSC